VAEYNRSIRRKRSWKLSEKVMSITAAERLLSKIKGENVETQIEQ
jgi:proline dehydrogenase